MKPQTEHPRRGRIVRVVVSLALGILIGGLFHYLLYRFSLPSKPFIYVTF
jgi:high-affinity Fe2+/Pb2+ permease